MDHDKLNAEIQRLQDLLSKIEDPSCERYLIIAKRLAELVKLRNDFDEVCDKQLERQDRLDLERDRLAQELEFKRKELEFKMELEQMKIREGRIEAAERKRAEKRHALLDIIKILAQIIGSGILIAVTGRVEQTVILGAHKWSLIPKLFKT